MGAIRCRIDDRLLHAEVLFGELEAGTFDQLLIASHLEWVDVADVGLAPNNVDAALVAPGEVAARLTPGRALVVLGTLTDLIESLEAGLTPDEVVLANRARRPDCRPLSDSFWADPEELRLARELLEKGLRPILQRVPTDEPRPLDRDLLDSIENDAPNPLHDAHDPSE